MRSPLELLHLGMYFSVCIHMKYILQERLQCKVSWSTLTTLFCKSVPQGVYIFPPAYHRPANIDK